MISENLLAVLQERVLWWPCLVDVFFLALLFDLMLFENLPDLIRERMILFDKCGTLPSSPERNGMFASRVLMHPFS